MLHNIQKLKYPVHTMKNVRLLFIFANLCTLMLVVSSSNPDSEIFQDSSEEDGKASSSSPLSDYRNNPRMMQGRPERDPYVYSPRLIITVKETPFIPTSRFSQWMPMFSPYGTRRVTSFGTGGTMTNNANNNNNNKVGNESDNGNGPDTSNISSRSPANGDGTTGTNQDQQKTNILPPHIPSVNYGVPDSSNIPNNVGNRNNQGVYVPPIQVDRNNPSIFPNRPNGNMPANWPNRKYPMTSVRTTSQPSRGNNIPNNPATSVNGHNVQSSAISTPAPGVKNSGKISPDANLFAGMINDFAFELVRALNLNTNFVISPLSIFNALTICYLASDGNTKAELAKALTLDKNSVHGEIVHQSMKDLISIAAPKSAEYQLFIANGMFVGKNYSINPEFEQDIQRFYDGQLQKIDFGDPRLSMQIINNWVGEVTRNTIPSFVSNIHPLTRILLLNAVYFKGIWKKEFPPHATYEGRFNTLAGDSKSIPTMPLYNETFYFLKSKEHKHSFIKLPYEGNEISMIIALPFSNSGRPMKEMTDRILCHIRDAMKETRLDSVTIPKFRLEFTKGLKKALTSLGMPSLFNSKSADLSNLRKEKDMYVSDVHHKAVIEINEQGTIAAATTAVDLVPLIYQNTTDFFVDHPFAFYIIHESSGLVLFYGKIYDLGV